MRQTRREIHGGNKMMKKVKGQWVAALCAFSIISSPIVMTTNILAAETNVLSTVYSDEFASTFDKKDEYIEEAWVQAESQKAVDSITNEDKTNTVEQIKEEIKRQEAGQKEAKIDLPIYVIQFGDELPKIADALDVDANDFAKLNNLKDSNKINVGDLLMLPNTTVKSTPSAKTDSKVSETKITSKPIVVVAPKPTVPPTNGTKPVETTTAPVVEVETTVAPKPVETTTAPVVEVETTVTPKPVETTTAPVVEVETTVTPKPVETTTAPVVEVETTVAPKPEETTTAPVVEVETTVAPKPEETTTAPVVEVETTVAPKPEETTTAPVVEVETTVAPKPEETTVSPKPEAPVELSEAQIVDRLNNKIFEFTNELRTINGLKPVEINPLLKDHSSERAKEIVNIFDHLPIDDKKTRLAEKGYNGTVLENIGRDSTLYIDRPINSNDVDIIANDIVNRYFFDGGKANRGHRDTMLSPYLLDFGSGSTMSYTNEEFGYKWYTFNTAQQFGDQTNAPAEPSNQNPKWLPSYGEYLERNIIDIEKELTEETDPELVASYENQLEKLKLEKEKINLPQDTNATTQAMNTMQSANIVNSGELETAETDVEPVVESDALNLEVSTEITGVTETSSEDTENIVVTPVENNN